jgi:fumarate reductase flavoprotein subunit
MKYTHYRVDGDLVSAYFDKSADTIEWLQDMGVEFAGAFKYFTESAATWHIVKPENGVIGPRAAGPMIRIMTEKAKELGTEIYLETPVKSLIMEDGKCVGVRAVSKDGEEIEARAKAVVVATGGFGTNADMIKNEFGLDLWQNFFPGTRAILRAYLNEKLPSDSVSAQLELYMAPNYDWEQEIRTNGINFQVN